MICRYNVYELKERFDLFDFWEDEIKLDIDLFLDDKATTKDVLNEMKNVGLLNKSNDDSGLDFEWYNDNTYCKIYDKEWGEPIYALKMFKEDYEILCAE